MAAEDNKSISQTMQLLVSAGDAKKLAQQALAAARNGGIDLAREKLTAAREKPFS